MKKYILLAILMIATFAGNTSFAQCNSGPIAHRLFNQGLDTCDQILTNYRASITYRKLTSLVGDTIKGSVPNIGTYYKYRGTGKEVAFIGLGPNNSGHLHLHDTLFQKGFSIKDTLSAWTINSYKNVSFRGKMVESFTVDTLGNLSVDSALKLNRLVTGIPGTDSVLGYNATSHNVVKLAPQAWLKATTLTGNGTGVATTFTLTIASGNTICIATSQNAAATVQSCTISGTTLTVTTTAAPGAGTGNVKFTVLYQ